jgi:UDP-4-amino-4,6-dideoxy-N-acetyl-beta-L-altrosamine transaminase
MIPYGRQSINEADIQAVVDVLQSDYLTQGPAVPAFEERVARRVGAAHGVAVNSATSALHIACMALGVAPGDNVWTSPITFVASANCARYCGATVDFVDIDPRTYNMSVDRLSEMLQRAEVMGTLPKVVIPVHLAGQSCDMMGIHALAKRYGFAVIEDASHAIGGDYMGRPIGDCRYSDVTIFSFHPVKIVTTAEGGIAMTNSADLASRMQLYRSHGITRDPAMMRAAPDGPWYYEQIALGYNYRMTDLQAALGLSQMDRLDDFIAVRRRLAAAYSERLAKLPLVIPWQDPSGSSAWHLYVIRVEETRLGQSHSAIFDGLKARGIGANLHYMPVYLQPYYRQLGFTPGHCPEAERYYAEAISLPLYATLSEADFDTVVDALYAIQDA